MINNSTNLDNIDEREKKRGLIVNEIVQTEKLYINQLETVVNCFLNPFKDAATIDIQNSTKTSLSNKQIKTIFSEIITIHNYNSCFYLNLKERVENSDLSTLMLGDIFLSIIDFFKSYSVYVNNYEKAVSKLRKVKTKYPNIVTLLSNFKSTTNDTLDLESYLICPIARVPRYVLLLTELIRYTDSNHQDFNNLNSALGKMRDLATLLNEKRKQSELMDKMLAIQNCLKGFTIDEYLIKPSRKLILDNEFNETVYNNNGEEKIKSTSIGRWLLFNDILIRTTVNGQNLIVKDIFSVDKVIFKELIIGEKFSIISSNGKDTIILTQEDINQQENWAQSIENCKNTLKDSILYGFKS